MRCHVQLIKPNVDIFFKALPNSYLPSHKQSSAERMVLVQGETIVTYE
jgi:hypothetical protein